MLDIDFIRKNLDKVKKTTKLKNKEVDFDKLLALDEEYRHLSTQAQSLRAERNKLAKGGRNETTVKQGKVLKQKIKNLEEQAKQVKKEFEQILVQVPNIAYDEVPHGKDETGNKEIKKVGEPRKFSFPPKSHLELIKLHDLADLERGAKISGFRGYFLKKELAILQMAVLWYAFMKLVEKGYTPFIAPALVKEFTLFGSGQLPWGKDEVYKIERDNLYLAGTAEVPITAYYSDEILREEELPKKFVAFSPCFRREAGNYGKDTKGLYRLHEFWKVEQVIIGEADEVKARQYHEELQANTEEILNDFKLAYRVVLMCTGDMGEPQAKKYDTEVWMPYRGNYGEAASNSIMTDFQTRRLKIRYRGKAAAGEVKYAYSLNDTAVASPRILIAILENYQQEDGSIKIPEALVPLCGFNEIRRKK